MLEKLAKQTAVYGISTIAVRFLSYLLTPYYTRIFGQETYGVVTDIYALIPLALTLLTMGMESSYVRFSAKAEEAGGDVKAAKRRLFATTWGVTSLAAAVFFVVVAFFRDGISHLMGEAYVAHPEYIVWVGLIILFDVWSCLPFSRLREQGRAMLFVGLKAMGVVLNVVLAVAQPCRPFGQSDELHHGRSGHAGPRLDGGASGFADVGPGDGLPQYRAVRFGRGIRGALRRHVYRRREGGACLQGLQGLRQRAGRNGVSGYGLRQRDGAERDPCLPALLECRHERLDLEQQGARRDRG